MLWAAVPLGGAPAIAPLRIIALGAMWPCPGAAVGRELPSTPARNIENPGDPDEALILAQTIFDGVGAGRASTAKSPHRWYASAGEHYALPEATCSYAMRRFQTD